MTGQTRALALGAVALLLAGCMGPAPTPAPTVGPTPVPTSATTPAPTILPSASPAAAAVDAAAWYPISIFPDTTELGPVTMTAVARTWFGFLAVGWTPRGGTSWWSADGRDWTAALYQDPSLRHAMLTGVAASDDRIVAVGSTESLDGRTQGQIWTSADGLAWTPTLHVPTGDVFVSAVARTATEFVAVGGIDDGDGRTVMWTSPDGGSWTETALDGGAPQQLADGPAGLLELDLLYDQSESGRSTATLFGPGGTTASDLPPGLINLIAAGPGGYWAFAEPSASDTAGRPVYHSKDGLTWTTAAPLPVVAPVSAAVVEADGSVVVTSPPGEPNASADVYRTRDGGASWASVTWPTAREPGAAIDGLAMGTDAVVGVGSIGMHRAATWVGQPAAAEPPGPLARDPEPTGCPSADTWSAGPSVVLDAVLRLRPAERLVCLGTRVIRVAGYLGQPDGLGGACAATATPDWLTGGCPSYPSGWLQPLAAPFGRSDTLDLFDKPSLPGTLKGGRWIVATGHFDDPASTTCRLIGPGPNELAEPIAASVEACREHFAVTAIQAGTAPATQPSDPAAFAGLPDSFRLAPAFEGWDNLALPAGTSWGFRTITPPGGSPVVLAVFRALSAADAAAVERAVIGDVGPASPRTVFGVRVLGDANGQEATFVLGSYVYRLQVEALDVVPPTPPADSLQPALEGVIRAALAR